MRGVLKYCRPRTNPISKRKYSREFRGDSSCTRAVKPGAAGGLYSDGSKVVEIAVPPIGAVMDTTPAGEDAFNAGFLIGWLTDHNPEVCCRGENALPAIVIQRRGAIIPAERMASLDQLFGHKSPEDVIPWA
jgi:sugar/nucleoside kinase (ribokinase family)